MYMKIINTTNFDNLKSSVVRQIATSAKCDQSYVRKLLNGEREANTTKAKTIIKYAKKINAALEKMQHGITIHVVGEND